MIAVVVVVVMVVILKMVVVLLSTEIMAVVSGISRCDGGSAGGSSDEYISDGDDSTRDSAVALIAQQ